MTDVGGMQKRFPVVCIREPRSLLAHAAHACLGRHMFQHGAGDIESGWTMIGRANQHTALLLVIGIAVAVTSIPVISRIFFDLKILHTRFARLVLGVAVIEDTVLWAVLAIATALATSAALPRQQIVSHVLGTVIYFGVGLSIAPAVFRWFSRVRWNLLATSSPLGYVVLVLFTYCALAARFEVSLVFAAFLA